MHTPSPYHVTGNMRQAARELRANQTPAEELLWECLRGRRLDGWRFRRQHVIGPYIADFFCYEARLVVELDGCQHAQPEDIQRDTERSAAFRSRGLRVLRFRNQDVLTRTADVLRLISKVAAIPVRHLTSMSSTPVPPD